MKIIDLRSDTVTKPTPKMRAAMAAAEVGDDVYGEDPTINKLEALAAKIFNREAALFVPTGSMGNQIAIRLQTQHGQEVICESRAHILDWEMGMIATFSGCTARTVPGERGVMQWNQIHAAIAPKIYYRAQTGLICLENSHNMAGGTVTPLSTMQEIWAGAKAANLPVHLDGARIFNAALAAAVPIDQFTAGFSTVNFCLSKGLGAPVGSVLLGSAEHMQRARSLRKALGGGMRQAGILAAAGILALQEGPGRLAQDHVNARLMADALAGGRGVTIDLESVQTNIVLFRVPDAVATVNSMKEKGVLASALGTDAVRLVTHFDVSREDCERAAEIILAILAA